jgi:hypothetical protein
MEKIKRKKKGKLQLAMKVIDINQKYNFNSLYNILDFYYAI